MRDASDASGDINRPAEPLTEQSAEPMSTTNGEGTNNHSEMSDEGTNNHFEQQQEDENAHAGEDHNLVDNYDTWEPPFPPLYQAIAGPVGTFGHQSDNEQRVLMLALSVDLNERTTQGWTPLMVSGSTGQPNIMRLLLRLGANIDAVDVEGNGALDWTRHRVRGFDGDIVLDMPLHSGHAECEKMLLAAAGPWSPATHALFPEAERQQAVEVLKLGFLLAHQPRQRSVGGLSSSTSSPEVASPASRTALALDDASSAAIASVGVDGGGHIDGSRQLEAEAGDDVSRSVLEVADASIPALGHGFAECWVQYVLPWAIIREPRARWAGGASASGTANDVVASGGSG